MSLVFPFKRKEVRSQYVSILAGTVFYNFISVNLKEHI